MDIEEVLEANIAFGLSNGEINLKRFPFASAFSTIASTMKSQSDTLLRSE